MSTRKRTWSNGQKQAWVVDYFAPDPKTGKRRRHLKTFHRQKDAKEFHASMSHEVLEGTHVPTSASVTLSEACDVWLKRAEAEGLERSTIRQYESHVVYHLKPSVLGTMKLSEITTPHVEAFKRGLEADKGKAMARKVLGSLKAIIREAQRQGLTTRNVAGPVTVRNASREKKKPEIGVDVPSREEVGAMIREAQGRWRPLVVVAAFCGLRSSELRGLTWDHVDFEENVIRVRQRADRWNQLGPPKSAAGSRDVPMGGMVANTLKEWKLQCPRAGVKRDAEGNVTDPGRLWLVFPNGLGNIENHGNIKNRGLAPMQTAAGIVADTGKRDEEGKPMLRAKYSLHAFRHFCASWLIGQGFLPKRLQTIMGHSSIQMTFDTYGHWLEQEDEHDRLTAAELTVVADAT